MGLAAADTVAPQCAILSDVVSLQQPVAVGLAAYVRARFALRVFGRRQLSLVPGTVVAPNHRSDSDVPLLVSALAREWAVAVRQGVPWPTFAADDHAFFRGFLAGYPEGLPLTVRRLLWPVRVGGVLERRLQCVPVRRPGEMRLVELLRRDPARVLDGQLPPELRAALTDRARQLGLPPPRVASHALRGGYADLLWTELHRDRTPGVEDIWREHLRCAVSDFRRLIAALRAGGLVVIFPEGELITDGGLGPFAPGLASLARRGHARQVQPIAISYDPLRAGRPRAYVSVGGPVVVGPPALTDRVRAAVAAAIPLTPGQIAAAVVADGGGRRELERIAEEWIARAQGQDRPVEPELLGPRRRRELAVALRHGRRLGPNHPGVRALARELHASASSS